MSQVAVIGLSSFGYFLAIRLSELGSQVLAIDHNEEMIDRIKAYVSKAVVADATDKRVLQELGLVHMDSVVLSLGEKLESSILAAMHLKEMGAKSVVAKALSEEHAKILELVGVSRVVFPERDMGHRVALSLHGHNIADYLTIGQDLSIVEMIPLREMLGKTLTELDFRRRFHCQVLAIKDRSGPRESTFIPQPETIIKENFLLVVMGSNKDIDRLQKGR